MVSGLEIDRSSHHAKGSPATTPQLRQIGDRLAADSWHIDAVLPPHAGEMVYEDLPPVADAMQECEVLQEGNEAAVFDDEELGVQVVELLGRRCRVAFPCISILRYLCLHVKVTQFLRVIHSTVSAIQHGRLM
ncbi:unnamed protein product [Ectocarpus sp. 4 AP-2014]